MSKRVSNPFVREYKTPDRQAETDAVEAFLQNGGKIQKLCDSRKAEAILKRRAQVQAYVAKRNNGAIRAGIPFLSDEEAITVSEE